MGHAHHDLADAKLAAALRQKAEAEAARQSAEQTIAERMKKVESQDDETRKAYEKQLREEQQRRGDVGFEVHRPMLTESRR